MYLLKPLRLPKPYFAAWSASSVLGRTVLLYGVQTGQILKNLVEMNRERPFVHNYNF